MTINTGSQIISRVEFVNECDVDQDTEGNKHENHTS